MRKEEWYEQVWVLYCLTLSPTPSIFSLMSVQTVSRSKKTLTHIGRNWLLLPFVCVLPCYAIVHVFPLLITAKWGRRNQNPTFKIHFLLIIAYQQPLFYASTVPFLVSLQTWLSSWNFLSTPLNVFKSLQWFDFISTIQTLFSFVGTGYSLRNRFNSSQQLSSFTFLSIFLLCCLVEGKAQESGFSMEIDLNHGVSELEKSVFCNGGCRKSDGCVFCCLGTSNSSQSPGFSSINMELWHACAGPLITFPKKGNVVVYFPQGHLEQFASNSPYSPMEMSTFGLKPRLFCRVLDVQLLVRSLSLFSLSFFFSCIGWFFLFQKVSSLHPSVWLQS